MDTSDLPQPEQSVARALPRAAVDATPTPAAGEGTLYEAVGGGEFFVRLVDAFYARVAEDAVLRPLYPDVELNAANERLRLFLIQYWGGPSTYSATRGHPRLRMRHAPFPVGMPQIHAWLTAMRGALDEVAPEPAVEAELWAYFQRAALFMRNTEA
ncbi:MAG TPA: globin [Euzebya sp.]|nr:globin [Euzebya sp.]